MKPQIFIATGNQGKFAELASLIKTDAWQISAVDLPLREIQDLDMLVVAAEKLSSGLAIAQKKGLSGYLLVDDTGLSIDALHGLPGPLIKWFLARMSLSELSQLKVNKKTTAVAQCVLGLGDIISGECWYFSGEVSGLIKPPGTVDGFGWDGIFYPLTSNKSYAEMSLAEKNRHSHRAIAARNLVRHLTNRCQLKNQT